MVHIHVHVVCQAVIITNVPHLLHIVLKARTQMALSNLLWTLTLKLYANLLS